jgi:hypothetical protein
MVYTKEVNEVKYILGSCDTENHKIIQNAQKKNFKGEIYWFHINDFPSGHCLVYLMENRMMDITIKTIACNYIKKYSKYKNKKVLMFCHTPIKNIIICDKPGEVRFYDMKKVNYINHEDTIIYHYSKYNGGNAAEYIIPLSQRGEPPFEYYDNYEKEYEKYSNFDITSHRIGSGTYGLATKKDSSAYVFKLYNPLILLNTEDCDNYMEVSRLLNGFFKMKKVSIENYKIAKFFNIDELKIRKKINRCMKKFHYDFQNRKDMVMMPINYLMIELNYDGVYSKGTIFDSFSKGNILFTGYPTKKNKLPINYIKRRRGVNEYIYKIN